MPYYPPLLPAVDSRTIIHGSADSTKLLRFEVDGFTTGTTRVLTPPNADATIAGLEVAQTFTAAQTISNLLIFSSTTMSNGNKICYQGSGGAGLRIRSDFDIYLEPYNSAKFFGFSLNGLAVNTPSVVGMLSARNTTGSTGTAGIAGEHNSGVSSGTFYGLSGLVAGGGGASKAAAYLNSTATAGTNYGLYIDNINTSSGTNFAIVTNAGNIVFNEGGDSATDFRVEGDTDTHLLFTDADVDRVGINDSTPDAKLDVVQSSTTAAIPVLAVEQADVSEEFIRFIGTSANGVLTQSIVENADVATPTLQGWLKVFVQDDGNQLTDQAYFVPIYTLA